MQPYVSKPLGQWSFLTSFGSCPKCMRQSLLATLAAWGAVILLWPLSGVLKVAEELITFLIVAASVLFLLSLTHLLVFAARRCLAANTAAHVPGGEPEPLLTRRSFMSTFLRSLAYGAALAASPRLAQAACPNGTLTCQFTRCSDSGTYCCPRGYPWLNPCNCKCYETFEGLRAAGCNGSNRCFSG